MRAFAILVCGLALAVFLVAEFKPRFLFPSEASREPAPPAARQSPAPAPIATRASLATNSVAQPPQGFYVGKGNERVYINYATPDPVLRSFMQSVMDGSSDPNAKGREIFLRLCAACHQPGGQGKDGLAPPLKGSEWALTRDGRRPALIVLNGLAGPVQVQGRTWNLAMPPWRENLTDDQVAVVLNYVRTQLGPDRAAPVTPELVAAARKQTHPAPETQEELLRVSDP